MKQLVKEEVVSEVNRVLPPGGELWIWDANIRKKGTFVIMMKIKLPNGKAIKTGYGSKDCTQSLESISEILEKEGFKIKEIQANKLWFFIKAKKATK